jgi:hypothetical protein
MRTIHSMAGLLIMLAVCGFFFGLGQSGIPADPVPNCTQECKGVYSWWVAPDGVWSAQKAGTSPPFGSGDNTTHGIPDIFVSASS